MTKLLLVNLHWPRGNYSDVFAWSGDLSFSSPESDFLVNADPPPEHVEEEIWSYTMSHASSESDFMSSSRVHHLPTPAIQKVARVLLYFSGSRLNLPSQCT
jgi:hypothetical protein